MDMTESVRADVQTSIPVTCLLKLVEEASQENHRYLLVGDRLIRACDAMDSQRMCEAYAKSAKQHLEQFHRFPTGTINSEYARFQMENAAGHAGFYFCLLMRDLGIVDDPAQHPPMPEVIASNDDLKRRWEQRFAFARMQMYRED